ncbi:hypothetical protein LL037_08905 [Clostridium estertheticum]|uniref:Uncharacterized protein n=1 Tax=Clostridium estertheticum TaxID=238834 RepID=A0AA47EFZ2_9CLOT|nr:hypothetical protein [Clostridium estertheticum]MBU3154905.1 hypothetical protein [Clostridium estertheticum]MBU3200400.1 hypothetical protein [Clostridium estertheticum]WAG58729.1 hypothetical protein LL038_13785 [Clostridium estertheticum]WAG67231.1 hypothetical protein LL037_08905 [Clostridium estertheticum]
MLRLTLLEVILRSLPEEFLVIFAVYVFSKTVINVKEYIISSIIYLIAVYVIRLLPIQYGVHTILNIIIIILITDNINKISIIKSIKASIMTVILLFVCEGINVFIVQYVFKVDVNHVFSQPLSKILYATPSLVIFALIVFTYYVYLVKKNKLSEVMNGEDI